MKTSQAGIDLIKQFEGLMLTPYKCEAGVWTIGYGHTAGVTPDTVITEEQAEQLLRFDLHGAEECVNSKLLHLNQNQFDALVSFVFNVGCGNFSTSTLLKWVRLGLDPHNQFIRWVNADGKRSAGLHRRRLAESKLYNS